MDSYKKDFIAFAQANGALKFGEFTLKSGRNSPYFFNAGTFNTGATLAKLGQYYADAIVASGIHIDMLFGPAYKGIPLVATISIALAERHGIDMPWAFNRKEAKDHGEGGWLVGAPLAGRVLVVDDVITAGTAIREVAAMFSRTDAKMAAVMVALDRQEKGQGELSAIQDVEQSLNVPVRSIVGMADIIQYLEETGQSEIALEGMRRYRQSYGVEYSGVK
ncbi:MAG: orotate phosphoribosyltransferase [Gammaproteobacteria bacterium]|nr:orotate phosphoribosyltransferase [Gammaproteobacteria bacterium]MBQ0774280.1 orotate phosphoribosyltransferase [Gammaproteobacteria bacterium]